MKMNQHLSHCLAMIAVMMMTVKFLMMIMMKMMTMIRKVTMILMTSLMNMAMIVMLMMMIKKVEASNKERIRINPTSILTAIVIGVDYTMHSTFNSVGNGHDFLSVRFLTKFMICNSRF